MLKWKCNNTILKDLNLIDKENFDENNYTILLKKFVTDTESISIGVDKVFLKNLMELPEKGILYSRKAKTSENYSRNGYFTLYRWCATSHNAAAKINQSALALWEYLFGNLPPKLAELGGHKGQHLFVENDIWNDWYKNIS
jgi:hypothetical protein